MGRCHGKRQILRILVLLVIVDSGREQQFPFGNGVGVVVEKARGHTQTRRLAAQFLSPEVVQSLAQPLFQSRRQLSRLPARRAQNGVAAQLLLLKPTQIG